jgi:hypothetical protein
MTDQLAALTEAGVSIWLDDLSRERLAEFPASDPADHQAEDHRHRDVEQGPSGRLPKADCVRPQRPDRQVEREQRDDQPDRDGARSRCHTYGSPAPTRRELGQSSACGGVRRPHPETESRLRDPATV